MSAIRKPGIPTSSSVSRDVARVLDPIKENVEILTGVRSGVKPIVQLTSVASQTDIANKANEIIVRLNANDTYTALTKTALDAVFVASGASHAAGIVPDPGSTAGTTRFLREDAAWAAPPYPVLTALTASLAADVLLNNTANYFDGPSVAQGTTGTWFVSGTVTVWDTAGAAGISAKLWDGTTVIASTNITQPAASQPWALALSGVITSPTGNLRISAQDITSVSGKILFNRSGNSHDSTITAVRIA